ncbi:MAG: SAF domain-containing protein [Acidimicrobiales bacterium]
MTTILRPPTNARLNGQTKPAAAAKAPAPPSGLRRNRPRIAIGLVVIALCVLGVVTAVARGAERTLVLSLAIDVPAGTTLGPSDLIAVELPADTSLPTIANDDIDMIIGTTAAMSLSQGTLLHPSMVTDEARVPDGMVLLGIVVDSGQYPIDLREGDRVELVETGAVIAGSDGGVVNLGEADVRGIAEPTTGGKALVVSLIVPRDAADRVAISGSQGRISLVVVGSR